jgi:excisionase family DNA binding protein
MTVKVVKPPKRQQKVVTETDGMLRMKEAAEILNCSLPTMHRLVNSGQVPSLRVGSMLRIPKARFMSWIAANTTGDAASV